MASQSKPLVSVACPRNPENLPQTFVTTTLPELLDNSYIVAATHPMIPCAGQGDEDWFLSDFYAFNYPLHGLGTTQVWLTAADPTRVLSTYEEEGPYLHGNPYRTRRVVLSRELLGQGEITPVTVVKPKRILKRFLHEVRVASQRAKKENAPLLLLVFCHGEPDHTLLLNEDNEDEGFTIGMLKAAIKEGTRIILITTACYSGGWAMTPDLNQTALTATKYEEESNIWPSSYSTHRECGSIFASTLVDTLSSAVGPLVQKLDADYQPTAEAAGLQPKEPTPEQTDTYNSFCDFLLDICSRRHTRLWAEQNFNFSAQDDGLEHSWSTRTGVPLAHFAARWEALVAVPYTGPADVADTRDLHPENPFFADTARPKTAAKRSKGQQETVDLMTVAIRDRKALDMAKLFLATCEGDWTKGVNVSLGGRLRTFTKGGEKNPAARGITESEVIATVKYRWHAALLAERVISSEELAAPGDSMCVFWDPTAWADRYKDSIPDMKRRQGLLHDEFVRKGRWPEPSRARGEGPPFSRPRRSIIAAILQARLPEDEMIAVARRINGFMDSAREFYVQKAMRDQTVLVRGGRWLQALGRKVRDAFDGAARSD